MRQPLLRKWMFQLIHLKRLAWISLGYGEILRENVYIVSFVDWLTNWAETYAIADKKAQTVASLILTEIFPRYGAPLEILTNKGAENVNEIMREKWQASI